MNLEIEVKDCEANFLMELLKRLNFIKVTQLNDTNAELKAELKEAIEEVNLAKQGKIKLQSARDFLNEL